MFRYSALMHIMDQISFITVFIVIAISIIEIFIKIAYRIEVMSIMIATMNLGSDLFQHIIEI